MAGAPSLERALDAVLDRPGLLAIVVDLAGVPFLDSTRVTVLLPGAAEAVGRGAALRVTNARPPVARILRVTAVDTLLGCPDDPAGDGLTKPGWRRLR